MVYFKALSQFSPRVNEETHKNLMKVVSWLTLEPDTCQTQTINVIAQWTSIYRSNVTRNSSGLLHFGEHIFKKCSLGLCIIHWCFSSSWYHFMKTMYKERNLWQH